MTLITDKLIIILIRKFAVLLDHNKKKYIGNMLQIYHDVGKAQLKAALTGSKARALIAILLTENSKQW